MSTCVRFRLSLVVALWLILLASCGGSAAEPAGEAAAPEQATAAPAELTAPSEEAPADTPIPTVERPTEPPPAAPSEALPDTPTEAPAEVPTALPTEALPADAPADALPLMMHGYGVNVGELDASWALVVLNPNTAYALEDSRYTMIVFDAAGTVIHTEEGALPLVLPGQMLGVAGALLVGDEEAVASLELVLQTGAFVAAATGPSVTAEEVTFVDGTFSDEVTGMLINPYAVELADLRVSAVAFDKAGDIVGGGTTILAALPAGGRAAVAVPVTVSSQPARVALFALVDGLEAIGE